MPPDNGFSIRPSFLKLVRNAILLKRALHLLIFALSGFAAFLLRFEFSVPRENMRQLMIGIVVWAIVKTVVFHFYHLDRGWWRFVSLPDVIRVGSANMIASAVSVPVILATSPPGFPRSLYILDLVLCFLATTGVRMIVRVVVEAANRGAFKPGKITLIYGAGAAGVMLLRESRSNPRLGFIVIGFIDDDSSKRHTLLQGVPVLGRGTDLAQLVAKHCVEQVVIALPSARSSEMREVLQRCNEARVECKTVPSMAEVIEGRALAGQIRDVAVDDLLGRNPVHLDESQIRGKIENQVVAITGAAGSIGSELCRQIARCRPAAIVAYECAETGLFHLERELRERFPGLCFYPEIGDIRNSPRLAEVFDRYRPSILYHAAAYKHVPMMEAHAFEAVENNVLGTWNVAMEASRHGIGDFVMISSDKAVRPTSVMGVTKRVAELLIHALQNGHTKYVSVRFGNVLGSNGSVIPLFKQQIAARKPLTVTHPEMCRYFMTIPEAAQLVLEASTMGKGGEIFVLDMGEPVRIVDLARNLILLSGLRPDEDIKIEFTGIRPGEKLYEELLQHNDEIQPTYHDKIKVFSGNGSADETLLERIEELRSLCATRDLPRLLCQLRELVPDYDPSTQILERALQQQRPRSVATAAVY